MLIVGYYFDIRSERRLARLTLDKTMLQDALRRTWARPSVAARSSDTSRRLTPSRSARRVELVASGGGLFLGGDPRLIAILVRSSDVTHP